MSVSGASQSSFGSGIESESGSTKGGPNNGEDGLDDNAHTFEAGLFGVLFTVSKEKNPSVAFVSFRLFMDWIQVFLLIVNPQYGWNIDPNNKAWLAFSWIQLNYFMSVRGYMFFLICMYILAIALAANLGLCIWVSNSFKNNKFDHVWPIVWLRYFSLVFYQVLDVASLTLFLMTMDCQFFPGPTQGYNQEFPDVACWEMPHMIHVAVAAASIAIFFVLACIFSMAEIELNPVSRNLMGMAHTKVEVLAFGIKMVMTCITVFVNGLRWMSVFQLIGAFGLCYLYLRWLPHLHAEVNHVRVASYFSVFWAALLFIIMAYQPGVDPEDLQAIHKQQVAITAALWAGFVPMGLLGAGLSYYRTRYFQRTVVGKFRDAAPGVKSKHIYKFEDAREVEIASRCCRKWIDEDTLEEEGVHLAELIVRAGVQQLSRNPYMAIWWSSFLIDVQGSYQSGYGALQDAKKMPNASFLERFCIFIREQEHTQKASAASSGDNANVDLVSYVEFQRNYRLAMRLHFEALMAKKVFWETLLHTQVTFDKLANAVQRIEVTVRASERMYRQVLARHSNSVKILVLYVKFLQNVRNDPWSAARWSAEAEKLQKLEEEANERAVFGEGGGDRGGLQNHDDSKGVIIMGANCLIRMINEPAATMFGYAQRAELVGTNINRIVPPPFSRNHNNYVRNYIQTGHAKILDQLREFVALHKDRYVVPINVFVTKVSGIGEDSVFMGIFQPVPPVRNIATLWFLNGGMVLSCDGDFTDWLGYKHEDIHAKPVADMVVNKEVLEDLMATMRQEVMAAGVRRPVTTVTDPSVVNSVDTPSWTAKNLIFKHQYLDVTIKVDISVKVGGIGETAMYACKITRKEEASHLLMVTDVKGRITHVTSQLADKLGMSVSKLQSGNMVHAMDALLPLPFMRIHHQWYKDRPDVPPAWSCRSGLSMCFNGMGPDGPQLVPFSLNFKRKESPGKEPLNLIQFEERTMEQMMDERRLSLVLNSQGIVTSASKSPTSLFGFDAQALIGMHLAYLVDVLCPPLTNQKPSDRDILEEEARATKMLMLMAEKSYEHPGMSWRVGVSAMMDPVALANLGPMGIAMMAKRTVPAVMVVDAYMAVPEMEGAKVLLPSEMQLKVELWKSDLMSGLLELDTQGNVVQLGIKDQPTFNPHLLMGVPPAMLNGVAFGAIMPTYGKPVLEALFTENGLSQVNKPGAGPGGRGGAGRGGIRNGGQFSRRRGIGPVHTVKLFHGTDGAELELTVQAVVKQDIGVGCSLFVLVHAVAPKCGRQDFRSWIWDAPLPGLTNNPAPRRASHRRASALSETALKQNIPKDLLAMYNGLTSLPAPPKHHVTLMDKKAPVVDELPVARIVPERVTAASLDSAEHPATPPDASGTDGRTVLSRKGTGVTEGDKGRDLKDGMSVVPEDSELMHGRSPEPSADQFNLDALAAEVNGDASLLQTAPRAEGSMRKGRKNKDGEGSLRSRRSMAATSKLGSKNGNKKKGDAGLSMRSGKSKVAMEHDDDADSMDSDRGGLKDGGHDRIKTWMSTAASASESDSGLDEEGSDEEEEDDDNKQQEEEEMEEDGDVEDIDEAGQAMNEFKRGKRLKKLAKMLMGPQAQGPNKRLKWVSICTVVALIVVDLAMFMAFMSMVAKQTAQVTDLRESSRAVNRVMQIAISTSAIEILLAGNLTGTDIRHLGGEGLATDLKYEFGVMETRTAQMDTYHRGIYRGFDTTRELPPAFGLKSIWDDPLLQIRVFFSSPSMGTFSQVQNMSLWDAGNEFIKCARNILQTADNDYGLASNNSLAFQNSTDVLYILYNGPRELVNAYQQTLDGLMQQAILDSQNVNRVQLIILAIEGGLVGMAAVITVWITTSIVVFRRFAIFSVFMVVPSGIIKGLATKQVDLEEADEDDREPGEGGEEGDAQAAAEAAAGMTSGNGDDWGGAKRPAAGQKINFNTQGNQSGKVEVKPTTFMGKMLAALPSFLRPHAQDGARKRRLLKSMTAVLWITWPFMLWAAFVIVINCMGYMALQDISSPIAISNIVQFMSIRVNRVVLFSQRFVSEQYLDPSIGYVAGITLPRGVFNPLKTNYRHTLSTDYTALRLEFDAMLYGREGALARNQTEPHFQLASSGIMFTQGADLMYNSRQCFCQTPSDCQPSDSEFYRFTMNGLDQMIKEFFYSVEALLLQPDSVANLASQHFVYIYEIGNFDLTGGLIALTDVYSTSVVQLYSQVLTLHIVALIMCCGMGLLFLVCILRPNLSRVTAETKRVAELLSQLPPEVDVEGMLTDALKTSRNSRDVQAEMEAAAAAKEEAKLAMGARSMARSRRASMDDMNGGVYPPKKSFDAGGKRGSLDMGARSSMDRTVMESKANGFQRGSLDLKNRDSAMQNV